MDDADIRQARPDDAADIRRIARRGWHAAYDDILRGETIDEALADWYDLDGLRTAIGREQTGYFVAEQDGEVVGFASGQPSDDPTEGRLDTIYVDPERWGRGIGGDLLAAVESFCRECGCETLCLRVLAENDVGRSFYRTHGYTEVEKRETDLFEERVRDVLLRRSL